MTNQLDEVIEALAEANEDLGLVVFDRQGASSEHLKLARDNVVRALGMLHKMKTDATTDSSDERMRKLRTKQGVHRFFMKNNAGTLRSAGFIERAAAGVYVCVGCSSRLIQGDMFEVAVQPPGAEYATHVCAFCSRCARSVGAEEKLYAEAKRIFEEVSADEAAP